MTITQKSTFPALLLLLYVYISASVTVTTRKPKLEVHENTNAVLSCEFRTERETHPRVEWKKRAKDVSYVYFDGEFTDSFKGRASIDGATVTLRGVTQKDSGVYQCEVTARHDKIKLGEVMVTLSVLVPPHAPSCHVPETVVRGYSVEMHCKDKLSVPPATYSWYKDNKPLNSAPEINYSLDPKTGTLKFKSVSKSDEGQYRCEAANGVGAPKSCAGRHMRITEFELNLTLVIAVGVGAFLLLLSFILAVCLCCRRGCCCSCHHKSKGDKKQSAKTSYNPPTDPRHYRHTQSFVL
ncbi:junctional adhesion molecule 2b isoform X1 [Triplophysa rosa]|uniref:junctional adhesion molecule 2b isoform X1 n=1 Tax=Triplophysa rosa TaxID=992332 RepID=UPI002545D824|nr:junctional adhesion molecule 2b isoform X1 [Triplophysa rosa]